MVYALVDADVPAMGGSSTASRAVGEPLQRPSSISAVLWGSAQARSRTQERSGGGKRALKRFSAARKGVHSLLIFFGRFFVALRYWRCAFL